ncbi:MAG TPA: penicillin acylase family protein [Terriglobales bacterium]|jgi:penicillin amidase
MHVTVPAVPRSGSRLALRIVIIVLALLLLIFLGFDYWFYHAVQNSAPQRDGTMQLSGLVAPVTVTYDARGVPNISAFNIPDLFFAQGYVTAQDRLWQMDMLRRFTSGDLAVVLGRDYIKYDRENRILGLREVAEKAAAQMDPQTRAQFEAYAAGVNAYILQHRKTLPLEFRFLGYAPHVWTVEDSLLVGLSMTEFLNHWLYKDKLEKENILARLGPQLTADLFVNRSWRDHPPIPPSSIENDAPGELPSNEEEEEQPAGSPKQKSDLARPGAEVQNYSAALRGAEAPRVHRSWLPPSGSGQSSLSAVKKGEDQRPLLPPESRGFLQGLRAAAAGPIYAAQHLRPGSNNWVLSGAHTASGKPLLSNDMHLQLQIPNIWYEAHLTAGDFDVAGVTLPGLPYVVVGHNQRIAWGFTNLGPNVEDIYVEKFNDQGQYLTPQGWMQPQHRQEIIRVKGGSEITLDVVTTRHGPIITDLVPGEARKLALKWTAFDPRTSRVPFFAIDSAQNWQQFQAAFAQFGAPAQNVVYADIDGHIGYQATGLIPIRSSGDGSTPVPGDDDAHEWTGYVPFDKLPSVYDPPSGIIATANGRVTPDDYPYSLSIEWMSPYRTQRLYKLLSEPRKFTPADMLAIQTDVVSPFDRFCAERFVYSIDHTPKASKRAREAAELMRNWDGTMDVDSAAATIAVYSRDKLNEMLLKAKLGNDWTMYRWFPRSVWLEDVLTHEPARWLPGGYSSYDQLLTAAVEAAVSDPGAAHVLSLWRWGRMHRVEVTHPFWSHFPILKKTAGTGSQPWSGDENTIKQVTTKFAPSERLTVDFANLDGSTLDIVNGQSGDIFDDHYNDQWDAYYHGRTFPLPFSPEAVHHTAAHRLTLEPQ